MFQLNINGGGGVQFDSLIACSVRSLPVYYIHANKSRGIYKIEKKIRFLIAVLFHSLSPSD